MMKMYPTLPLADLPLWQEVPAAVETMYREALAVFDRKVIALDDDPTGIQTVHGVNVYTDWTQERLLDCFRDNDSISFILTNSRSFTAAQTETVHRDIAERVCRAAAETGRDYVLISRGDSTMRGHWPLETQTLAEAIAQESGRRFDGEVILPFFKEGGRFTFGNVHYVKDSETLVPAGETEFAKDATFGYTASGLDDWCEEKTGGTCRAEDCICIALEDIRALDVEKIAAQLIGAKNFAKVIVNAVCYEDLKVFCAAYVKALAAGKEFLFRTAAGWTKILGGISDKPLLTRDELISGSAYGGIVLVGSHVNKTTLQLQHLRESGLPIHFEEFDATLVAEDGGLEREVARVIAIAEARIQKGESVGVYTTRKRIDPAHLNSEQRLQMSVAISDAVTSIIGKLTVRPAFIVAKGGITSSDVGVKALQVKKAKVMGQIMPGIPVWMTGAESKFPDMPYVIFPGNVGEVRTLTDVVRVLMGE